MQKLASHTSFYKAVNNIPPVTSEACTVTVTLLAAFVACEQALFLVDLAPRLI